MAKIALKIAQKKQKAPTEKTKTTVVLELLRRPTGASISDVMHATGWQGHSVRGFLSGTVKKKLGLVLASDKDKGGERRYRVTPTKSSKE